MSALAPTPLTTCGRCVAGWLSRSGFCSCAAGRSLELHDLESSERLRRQGIERCRERIARIHEEIVELEVELGYIEARRLVLS